MYSQKLEEVISPIQWPSLLVHLEVRPELKLLQITVLETKSMQGQSLNGNKHFNIFGYLIFILEWNHVLSPMQNIKFTHFTHTTMMLYVEIIAGKDSQYRISMQDGQDIIFYKKINSISIKIERRSNRIWTKCEFRYADIPFHHSWFKLICSARSNNRV